MNRERNVLILLAGGRGKRMESSVPKQFMELCGKPLIWYSLAAVQRSDLIDDCILVSSAEDISAIRALVDRYGFDKVSAIVCGGEERYLSVIKGVNAVMERSGECETCAGTPGVILVHDGARPFIDDEIIKNCLEGVDETGGCVAAVPSKDTVKLAGSDMIVTQEPPRKNVWCMQTPQVFKSVILFEACKAAEDALGRSSGETSVEITDDAQMVKLFTDTEIKLVMGSYENIKVTTPVDMIIAEKILEEKSGHIS